METGGKPAIALVLEGSDSPEKEGPAPKRTKVGAKKGESFESSGDDGLGASGLEVAAAEAMMGALQANSPTDFAKALKGFLKAGR
jgi:hypothetical protein